MSNSVSFKNGKLVVTYRGREHVFSSVSEYIDAVQSRGGSLPSEVQRRLRDMELQVRHSLASREAEHEQSAQVQKGGTPHWLAG